MFLGEPFSEADLLGYAYDYEQASLLREEPTLVIAPQPVPEPSALIGLAALSGLAWVSRRRVMAC
ncbi:MAG: PEP-CTERM sorting domain-containing protein [Thainema sp.]